MSASDWREIYGTYTGEELAAEIGVLKKDLAGGFSAQASGSVSHQRNIAELRDRLNAAIQVQRNRSGKRPARRGVVDFGG